MLETKEILGKGLWELNMKQYRMLRKAVRNKSVTWILGAGISRPAGLPNWSELLARMWARLSELQNDTLLHEKMYKQDEWVFLKEKSRRIKKNRNYSEYQKKMKMAFLGEYKKIFYDANMLEIAEYIWNYIEMRVVEGGVGDYQRVFQNQSLKALVRDSLQITFTEKELINRLKNQTLGYLAELLHTQGNGNVLTYNYDDLLEFCLDKIEKVSEEKVQVICDYDKKKYDRRKKIYIHHLHGALKIAKSKFSKESENIVLTEQSYYRMEQKYYNWENSVQAKALNETSCIFVGFSGDDYNFRRIIKNVDFNFKRHESMHYTFLCLDNLFDKFYKEETEKRYKKYVKSIIGNADLEEKEKNKIRKEIVECDEFAYERIQFIDRLFAQYHYWRRHGIIPIWTTFDELPELIHGFYG